MTIAKRAAAARFEPPEEEKPPETVADAPAAQVVREKMPRMTD